MTSKPEQTSAELADAVAPFVRSSRVREVASEVIDANPSLRSLLDLEMEYVLKTKKPKEDPAIDDLCRAIIVGEPWRSLTGLEVVVWVSGEHWRLMGDDFQRGMLTHALSHVLVTEEGQIKKAGHDVDAFIREVKTFGPWTARLSTFFRSLGQEPAKQTTVAEAAEAAVDALDGTTIRHDDGTVAHISTARSRRSRPAAPKETS